MNKSQDAEAERRQDLLSSEAARLADTIPDAWLMASDGEVPQDPRLQAQLNGEDGAAVRALFTPIEPGAEVRLVEQILARYPPVAPEAASKLVSLTATRRRRWWLVGVPLIAAAAGVILLLRVDLTLHIKSPPELATISMPLAGQVRATSSTRGPEAETQRPLTVRGSVDWFYLDCQPDGRPLVLLGVQATREGMLDRERPVLLRATLLSPDVSTGARLHVHAELPHGRWAVTCHMFDEHEGQVVRLDPPTILVVK